MATIEPPIGVAAAVLGTTLTECGDVDDDAADPPIEVMAAVVGTTLIECGDVDDDTECDDEGAAGTTAATKAAMLSFFTGDLTTAELADSRFRRRSLALYAKLAMLASICRCLASNVDSLFRRRILRESDSASVVVLDFGDAAVKFAALAVTGFASIPTSW